MPITVYSKDAPGQDLLVEANEEIAAFELFFREKLDNQPLTPSEKAILRTYLHWALVDRHVG